MPAIANTESSRHLESRVEQGVRVHRKQPQSGKANRIQSTAFTPQDASEEKESDHPERTLNGLAVSGKECVAERKQDRDACGCDARHSHRFRYEEDKPGKDCQVHSGNNQQVKRSCPFKAGTNASGEIAAISGQHGRQHRRIFAAQPKEGRNSC